ncbi:MAG: CcmD family protein [Chitinophagales bacterium]
MDQQAADFLRESDKLYVVISILVTIFAVLIIFLIFQERRISKLEKQLKEKNP